MHLSVCLQLCFLIYWTSTAFGQQGCNVTNKFGDGCRYTCHCEEDTICYYNGSCSEGCQHGWFGPACQYKDIEPISSTFVNRNETSKREMHKFNWDSLFKFTWMKIRFFEPEPVTGENKQISILFSKNGFWELCEKSIVTVRDNYMYTVQCDTVMLINSLIIDTDDRMPVEDVWVNGGLDDELGPPAGNTSTLWSSRFYKAVEESTNGYNCTASLVNTTNADVNNKDIIFSQYMFKRIDVHDQLVRLVKYNNSEVYSFNNSGHLTFMYMRNKETIQLIPYNEIYSNVSTTGVILELCEVHLFKEIQCTEIPRYTVHCNRRSNCLNQTEGCLFSTGQCPSGCLVGFTDECCTHSLAKTH